MRALLLIALRASGGRGPHSEAARNVVLAILLAQMLAGAGHEGPPHPAGRGVARIASSGHLFSLRLKNCPLAVDRGAPARVG